MKERKLRAAVVGATGYGGGEIIRRLLVHPAVELTRAVSIDHVDEPVASVHYNLEGRTDLRFEAMDPVEAASDVDVVFFGLPHEVSATVVPSVLEHSEAKVVDLSGAFRTDDAETYARWYGQTHPHPDLLPSMVYGLTELNRDRIRGARGVANPGCFATCVELALLPLAKRGWLRGSVEVVAMTGSSGSGVRPSAGTHHPVRAVNLKSYRPLTHPQTPEMSETLSVAAGRAVELRFVPVSAPLSRGILATAFARVPGDVDGVALADAYHEAFDGESFVRAPEGRFPEVAAVAGSNYAEVGAAAGPVEANGERVVTCFGALDNLVKGGAGQAVQNMNVLLDLDERLSLEDAGSWP